MYEMDAVPPSCSCQDQVRGCRRYSAGCRQVVSAYGYPCDSQGAGSGLDVSREEVPAQLQAVVRDLWKEGSPSS